MILDENLQDRIIALVHKEVIPAVGCTEPVAVALAVAQAAALMENKDTDTWTHLRVMLSANILKNAMGVGIPGTGMIGLPIAVSLGAVIAQPGKELTVLDGFTPEQLEQAKVLMNRHIIEISVKKGDNIDTLYIEIEIEDNRGETASAVISGAHTRFVAASHNGSPAPFTQTATTASDACTCSAAQEETAASQEDPELTFSMVYDFALETPIEKLQFINEAAQLNEAVSQESMKSRYGHAVGRMVKGDLGMKYLGQSALTRMISSTSAACDARMDGAPYTVMSNSGSGNQGITSTLPVLSFAREQNATPEQLTRALMLSSLMVIYIKQKLGRLSALCGCVVASTGAACAITYLLGGSKQQVGYAIKNMVGNITGMLCDGAKPSCSLKVSSGVSTAMFSSLLAMENSVVTSSEGIVDDDIDRTVENLTNIGKEGMRKTDELVLDIMTSKRR